MAMTLGMVATMMPVGTSLAASDLTVYVGSHEIGTDTNMVIEFTLASDVTAGDTWKFHFDADDDHGNDDGIFTGGNSAFDTVTLEVGGVTCTAEGFQRALRAVPADTNEFYVDSKDDSSANWIEFKVPVSATGTTCAVDTMLASEVVKIYLGANDADGSGGNSGAFTAASSLAATNFTNVANIDHIDVDLEIDFADNGSVDESAAGAYAVSTDETLNITATLDPYIKMTLANTTIALGDLDNSTVTTDATATVAVDTNSPNGYDLRYRSTPLQDGSGTRVLTAQGGTADDFTPVATTEKWGITTSTSMAGTATATTAGGYGVAGTYAVVTDGTLQQLVGTDKADIGTTTVTVAATTNPDSDTTDYSATITMNAYATF